MATRASRLQDVATTLDGERGHKRRAYELSEIATLEDGRSRAAGCAYRLRRPTTISAGGQLGVQRTPSGGDMAGSGDAARLRDRCAAQHRELARDVRAGGNAERIGRRSRIRTRSAQRRTR